MKQPKFFNICKMSQPQLKKYAFEYLKKMKYEPVSKDGFVYAKGTVPVLLVAHLDTVHKALPKNIKVVAGKASDVNGIGGDDRCGVYMIMKIIKDMKCSVLFTEDEEIGCVGAYKFCASDYISNLDVNYIIELDRKGSRDAVFYDCDNPEFTEFCTDKAIGFKEDSGTYTDISEICEASGIAGVNFSCGYYNAHTTKEYVDIPTMELNIGRVKAIIQKPVTAPFKFIKKKFSYSYWYGRRGSYSWYDEGYYSYADNHYSGNYDNSKPNSRTRVDSKKDNTYVMSFDYIDNKDGSQKTSYKVGATKEECWVAFFKDNPHVCYQDVIDWDTIDFE